MVDLAPARLSASFDAAYSSGERPSVPPERLLKALLLQCRFTIRSERELCPRIRTDLLFRWFLDMHPDEVVFDPTVFTHNRDRLDSHGLTRKFFDGVVRQAIEAGLASDDHFTVDGSLIQSHALFGERAGRLQGRAANLCHSVHALTENRQGLVLAVDVDEPNGTAERESALRMVDRLKRRRRVTPTTLGADMGFEAGPFLRALELRGIVPHVAIRPGRITRKDESADARRPARYRGGLAGYCRSQRKRKFVEEYFGWGKSIGPMPLLDDTARSDDRLIPS